MPPRQRVKNVKPVEDEEELPPPSKPSSSRKGPARSRVSAACEACKKRRTKCTGEPAPCHLCQVLGTECVIDLTLDMRRRAAMQQTIDDAKSYQESLSGLIDCIRDGDLEVIRSLQNAFVRDDITQQHISAEIQYWAGLVRSRRPELDRESGYVSTGLETSLEHYTVTSSSAAVEDQEDEWPIAPALRGKSTEQTTPNDFARLASLHRHLKDCSDVEGEQILAGLLKADDLAAFDANTLVRGTALRQAVTTTATSSRPIGGPAYTEDDRKYWHPALQLDVDPLTRDTPTDMTNMVPYMNSWESGQYQRHVDTPITLQSMIAPELRQISSSLSTSIEDATGGELGVEASRSVMAVQPAVTDLLLVSDDLISQTNIPIHLVQPLLVPDNCSMSRIYTDYLYGARQMIASKAPVSDFLGPTDGVVVDLYFRQRRDGDKWDCSAWASEFCRGFVEFDQYTRLAGVFLLTRLMQWLLAPTAESYAKLPHLMKPTPAQRMIPHIGAIDLIPLPSLRDAMIERLRDWLTPLAEAGCTVNWPLHQDDAVERDPRMGSSRLTQRFIDHVSNHDNWSVDSRLFDSIPRVAGRIRTHG